MGCDIHLFAEVKQKKNIIDWLMFRKRNNGETLTNGQRTDTLMKKMTAANPNLK